MTSSVQEQRQTAGRPARRQGRGSSFDVLRVPLLGRFLGWRWSRIALQIPVFLLSLIMLAHAFWGPELAPKNLAALLTWVHFRGLVVLVILLAGNLFCMACPFMLPRELARRWITPRWEWPRAVRNKWPAIGLFVAVLFVYELADLWSDPWWTGALIAAYFIAALVVDALFRRASFCKFVCPIGQFNFLGSTLSPLEVTVRDQQVCTGCRTKDCIRGVREPAGRLSGGPVAAFSESLPDQLSESLPTARLPIVQRGCELELFQPRKVGNLDCTFCLDCVYACPHDNIGILARLPAERLAVGGTRSGIGTLERRVDFSVLSVVFTFGALLNAFAMTSPVYVVEQRIAESTGLKVEWPILAGIFVVALVLEPALLMGGAALASRWLARSSQSTWQIVNAFARSLVPVGFGVWLAHYGFHFFTGVLTVIPVAQHAALQAFGRPLLGAPQWQLGGLSESIVFPLEVGFLGLGLLGSWLVGWSIAGDLTPRRPWRTFAPWALLHLMLFATALWIMTQPMDMRGTFLGG